MQKTRPLSVSVDTKLEKNRMVIHPNEGFDLGLMKLEYDIDVYATSDVNSFVANELESEKGSIYLENECGNGMIKISMPMWNKLGKPKQAILLADSHRICIVAK
ncbi:MAG: hypothetical protein JXR63_09225 [Spirochaetales bacterium]|nr:hypothetical protein [Spirochaetales bacterium]